MRWWAIILVAGCATPALTVSEPPADHAQLSGLVADAGLAPIAGAEVRLLLNNETKTTDTDGVYAFDNLPADIPLVLVASALGYEPSSKQTTLGQNTSIRLDFTLSPVPARSGTMELLEHQGFLACQGATGDSSLGCGAGENEDIWDFAVGAELAGVVVEIAWEAGTPAADSLGAKLETLDLGEHNEVLGNTHGTSPLRLVVPQGTAERYYASGGLMRLTVFARPDNEANETGVGGSIALQQDFEAIASIFYVAPAPGSYSAL